MRAVPIYVLAAATAIAASTAVAGPATGDVAAAACTSCHGKDGAGNAEAGFPALAQLPHKYFMKQIADFKSGTRTKTRDLRVGDSEATEGYGYYVSFMKSVAKALSAEDAEAAARYFEGLAQPVIVPVAADPAVIARGKQLAVNGDWDREIPPCFKCHAVDGRGVAPSFPPIAGQHAAYTEKQLQAWKTGSRTNDPQKLMKATVDKLTDDEIRSVAAYLATLGTRHQGGEK